MTRHDAFNKVESRLLIERELASLELLCGLTN
jgi:hypothetical protein